VVLELMARADIAAVVGCCCRVLDRPWYEGCTRAMCPLFRYKDGEPRPITFYSHTTEHLLNSGLLVVRPDAATAALIADVMAHDPIVPTLHACEQELLSHVFRFRLTPLHWRYNALKRMFQDHAELWDEAEASNIHYILDKPWDRRVRPGDEFERLHAIWCVHGLA
jgi:hypothetical protein